MTELIYKILRRKEWQEAVEAGRLIGSPDDVRDGFIHFSNAAQADTTFNKYFSTEHNLILLAVEPERLGSGLKWEVSRGGERFPHFYGMLRLELVHSIGEIRHAPDGRPIFPFSM